MKTFKELFNESIINVNKLKSKEGTKKETEKGRTTIRGYVKSSSFDTKTSYFNIAKSDAENILSKLKDLLSKKITSVETTFDDSTWKDIGTIFNVSTSPEKEYDYLIINMNREDNSYAKWGKFKTLDTIIKDILEVVGKWSKEEIFLELEGNDINILNSINKGKASVEDSFIIKLNFTDSEYIMSNKLNIPKKY